MLHKNFIYFRPNNFHVFGNKTNRSLYTNCIDCLLNIGIKLILSFYCHTVSPFSPSSRQTTRGKFFNPSSMEVCLPIRACIPITKPHSHTFRVLICADNCVIVFVLWKVGFALVERFNRMELRISLVFI